jgi:hypothetical protein
MGVKENLAALIAAVGNIFGPKRKGEKPGKKPADPKKKRIRKMKHESRRRNFRRARGKKWRGR